MKINKILLISVCSFVALLLIISLIKFRSCSKPGPLPAFNTRDSVTSVKIDSVVKNSESIQAKKNMQSEKIMAQKYKRKLNEQLLKKDYEIIENSPSDSAYIHILEYLRNWKPVY